MLAFEVRRTRSFFLYLCLCFFLFVCFFYVNLYLCIFLYFCRKERRGHLRLLLREDALDLFLLYLCLCFYLVECFFTWICIFVFLCIFLGKRGAVSCACFGRKTRSIIFFVCLCFFSICMFFYVNLYLCIFLYFCWRERRGHLRLLLKEDALDLQQMKQGGGLWGGEKMLSSKCIHFQKLL